MPDARLQYLVDRYLNKTCTPAEREELASRVMMPENETDVRMLLEQYWERVPVTEAVADDKAASILDSILQPVAEEVPVKVRPMFWRRFAAAAAVLLLAAGGFWLYQRSAEVPVTAGAGEHRFKHDIPAPVVNKATLTLANGTTIVLDTAGNGAIIANASKIDSGSIAYNGGAGVVEYHTLKVPAGSRPMQLKLADGSRVWLNVGSSITYPTAFPGKERKVTMTGEAYFEIAKDAGRTFTVATEQTTTEVLGTHFNINSYTDEAATRITLLEGKVKVSGLRAHASGLLEPGQQAQVQHTAGKLKVISDADERAVMAWRNGMFQFEKADIGTVMRQVARWYDVDVIYHQEISTIFGGEIPRDVSITTLLKMLEETGHVHFIIEGRTVTVIP